MGNCSNCNFCTEEEVNNSKENSLRISTDSVLGYSQATPTNSICCCKTRPIKNNLLLEKMKLSSKEKEIFEKKNIKDS
jgi:hypothetical protein